MQDEHNVLINRYSFFNLFNYYFSSIFVPEGYEVAYLTFTQYMIQWFPGDFQTAC